MQSGFPTASLPRGVDTASNADRPAATSRPSATSRRDDGNEPARDNAFSDMVAASRQSDETAGSKPAGRSKSGEVEAAKPAAEAAPSSKSGNSASQDSAAGKTASDGNAAPATGSDASGNGQAASGDNTSKQQGMAAQAGASGTAAAAAQTSAQATGQANAQVNAAALSAEAATAPRSSGGTAGAPAQTAATPQSGQASTATQTPDSGNKGAAPASGATAGSSASATGATGSAATGQAGQSETKADARVTTESSRTPTVITTAGTGETGTTTAQSGVSLPDAASPAGQTAASQAGQAAASQASQVRTAQAGNGRTGSEPAPVAGKPASVAKSGNQSAKPAPASNSVTATGPSTVPPGANTAADPTGSADTAAPLREGRETRAILETGNSGGLAGSGRKTAAAQGQGAPSSGTPKSGTTAPTAPTTTEVRPDAAIQLPRDAAPGNPSPLGQLLATNGGAGDTSQPLQTVETDTAQADAEIQLNRAADARAGVDRAGSNLPRFAPHTAQQLAGQITRNFNNGQRVFDIRLDPAELGKVDVRLELRADNRVHAVLTAERPETLAELQRAARDLERSLNDAGLELAEDGLSFQMSEDGQTSGSEDDTPGTTMPIFADGGESGLTAETAAPVVQQSRYGFLLTRREGVDMRV
jgi:hypothetical protein